MRVPTVKSQGTSNPFNFFLLINIQGLRRHWSKLYCVVIRYSLVMSICNYFRWDLTCHKVEKLSMVPKRNKYHKGETSRDRHRDVRDEADRLGFTSSWAVVTSNVTCSSWYFCRSTASDLATPAESFGSQMIGGGAISSGAYKIPAISSAWSANGNGGR